MSLSFSQRNMQLKTLADLDEVQQLVLNQHAQEIIRKSEQQRSFDSPLSIPRVAYNAISQTAPFALLKAVYTTTKFLLFAQFASPGAWLVDPFGALYGLFAYVVCLTVLWFSLIALCVWKLLGLSRVAETTSKLYGGRGLSICNWAVPSAFDNRDLVKAAVDKMHEPFDPLMYKMESRIEDVFDLDIARFLLLCSALVYERDASLVALAPKYSRVAPLLLRKSEAIIEGITNNWGSDVRYVSVSDLSNGAQANSYACIWYSKSKPFIVLAFKGTTPDQFGDFVRDATITRQDAGDVFGAGVEAHGGFYDALFPSASREGVDSPYRRILIVLREVARFLRQGSINQAPIPLFVTGHSMGAGIAQLMYYRLLAHPEELCNEIVLRDSYLFGTPRALNANGASAFEKLMGEEINAGRNLFRLANRADVVAFVPPGLGDKREGRTALTEDSLLNFAHIGRGLHLNVIPPYMHSMAFFGGVRAGHSLKVVEKGTVAPVFDIQDSHKPPTPISLVDTALRIFVFSIWCHLPSSYINSLARVEGEIVPEAKSADEVQPL